MGDDAITRCTMITTTSYGAWLPGDARGYVQRGEILPAAPRLKVHAQSLLKSEPVIFSTTEQAALYQAIVLAAYEFEYRLTDTSVEAWHLHWIVYHGGTIKAMVGRLKTRMRQALSRGRIWTEGYNFRELKSEEELVIARKYIARHQGARLVNGNHVAPGSAGG